MLGAMMLLVVLLGGALLIEFLDDLLENGFGIFTIVDKLTKEKEREFKTYTLTDETTKTNRTRIDFTPIVKK